MIGIGSDKNILKHEILTKKIKNIFRWHTSYFRCQTSMLHWFKNSVTCVWDFNQTWNHMKYSWFGFKKCLTEPLIFSIKHETWNCLKYSWFGFKKSWTNPLIFSIKHETAWKILGLHSRKVGQSYSYFQRTSVGLANYNERTPDTRHNQNIQVFFTGPPWKWQSARP